ncbi:hypothetical protein MRB53_023789 [Persea americana]|uniref:Uncharacterized protein n=1 Tax=Persea americana TaxID=3435 RepID=A0ACC2LAL6_PERAE|nr:hypothetical protein MRB53_023789 [Persea americana]
MRFQIPMAKFPLVNLLLLLLSLPNLPLSLAGDSQSTLICGATRPLNSSLFSLFLNNFITGLENLKDQVSIRKWSFNVSGKSSTSPVYSAFQCFSNLSQKDCQLCYAKARPIIPSCIPRPGRILVEDGCFLRYDNYSFLNETIDDKYDKLNCSSSNVVQGEAERSQLTKNVEEVVGNMTKSAVDGDGFGAEERGEGEGMSVYGMAQCWKSLSREECRECLEKAGSEVRKCLPAREGKALNAGCFLRYSPEKISNAMGSEGKEDSRRRILIAVLVSLPAVALLSIICVYVGYRRLKKGKQATIHLGKLSSSVEKSGLKFKYETLEKATEFFDPSRKLGQGASGSVYKGILRDGRIVAVKRLFFNTRQWADEFFNEVNLINKNNSQSLSWQQRFDIIVGTAEGLAYLHVGSPMKIIHRDIKTSNILLDDNLEAKIADFGLVRCVAPDKSHLSTGIAGTLGYMAPEYLVRGQLTEKADVYSFGVLVLEVVCGRQSNVFIEESSSLLHNVWKHYKSGTLPETVDESLRDHFPAKVASNVLQIGLLCTQALASLRPSMSEVVQMLTDIQYSIPLPMQPPFLNSTVINQSSSTISTSVTSTASSATTSGLATPKTLLFGRR